MGGASVVLHFDERGFSYYTLRWMGLKFLYTLMGRDSVIIHFGGRGFSSYTVRWVGFSYNALWWEGL